MNDSSNTPAADSAPQLTDVRLYEILIEELRRLHGTWIDNFRVILTFNSLLLPATFAILVFVSRGDIAPEHAGWSYPLLAVLSCIGILVTIVGVALIRRIKAITALRQRQVRKLEAHLVHQCTVAPWTEGYCLFGGTVPDDITNRTGLAIDAPEKMAFAWLNAFWGFTIIAAGFLVAYALILVVSFVSMTQQSGCDITPK